MSIPLARPRPPRFTFPGDPGRERLILAVPWAQYERAKLFGVRWDKKTRQHWVTINRATENPGVHQWMAGSPEIAEMLREHEARMLTAGDIPAHQRSVAPRPPMHTKFQFGDPTPPALETCNCSSPPWETCQHSLQPGQSHHL